MLDIDEKRVELIPYFKEKLFNDLLNKFYTGFGSINKICKILNINRHAFNSYRRNYTNTIPLNFVYRIAKILDISEKKINKNISRTCTKREIRNEIFFKGQEFRKNQFKKFRENIPSINHIYKGDYLDLELWFNSYVKIINFGSRHFISINKDNHKIIMKYTNYSNSKKKLFTNYLPIKIKIDGDFIYFFGLWCGDRCGRGRFGVANKNKSINFYTKYYLEKLYQNPKFILNYSHKINIPKLDYQVDEIVCNNKSKFNGYCISVCSYNNIMFRFFDYLYQNLDEFLGLLTNLNIFLAGLFDAEGNVSLEDKCFRWSCKNERNIVTFKNILIKLNIFRRYDGSNLISYDKEYFKMNIFPYLKNEDKINRCNLILNNYGFLEKRFLKILGLIKNRPNLTYKELSKNLKRVKVYSQVKFLENLDYVKTYGYPKMIQITHQGSNQLHGRQGQ